MSTGSVQPTSQAKSTAAPSPTAAIPVPSAYSGGVYRNTKMGIAVDVPHFLTVDDSSSSAFLTQVKTALTSAGMAGFKSHIGGLVAFLPGNWSMSDGEPGGYAVMWRQPPSFSRTQLARMIATGAFRKVASAQAKYGPGVKAVATHVGHVPAIKETIRTTDAGGAVTARFFWLYTPTSEYAFYGWTRTSREKTWLALFDQITSSLTVSK